MRSVTAYIGRRPGGRTFLLMSLRNERERRRFGEMAEALRVQRLVPDDTYAIMPDLPGHDGEVLIVLPPADGTGGMIQAIKRGAAMRLNLHVGESDMQASDYAAYNLLAAHAESQR